MCVFCPESEDILYFSPRYINEIYEITNDNT
jgi:hypothetical protein